MKVLDLAVVGELLVDVVLLSLLVDASHEEDPAFDRTLRAGLARIVACVGLKKYLGEFSLTSSGTELAPKINAVMTLN